MKISKYSHQRMAVVLQEKQQREKGQEDKTIGEITPLKYNLKTYVRWRVEKAASLYQVLGAAAKSDLDKKKSKAVCDCVNRFIKDVILEGQIYQIKNEGQIDRQVERIVSMLKSQTFTDTISYKTTKNKCGETQIQEYCLNNVSAEFVHELVRLHLRGSLKKEVSVDRTGAKRVYLPDIIVKLVMAVCQKNNFKNCMQGISTDELKACIKAILEDYTKLKQINDIVRSIENQDVKIQVFGEGENCCLKLAGAGNPKKKYVFQFIEEYACADKESRNKMLGNIRRLMLLFFAGESAYLEAEQKEVPLWGSGFLSKMVSDIPRVFEPEAEKLLLEKEKSNSQVIEEKESSVRQKNTKEIDIEVKKRIRQEIIRRYREAESVLKKHLETDWPEYEVNKFWLKWIEDQTEKQLLPSGRRQLMRNKLDTAWLFDTIWKNFNAFLASKYVDMGKGVYHFAMPDLHKLTDGKARAIGEVRPQFREGITSFDYERVSAEEKLERSFIIALLSAVNNYASAVCPDSVYEGKGENEDILQFGENKLIQSVYPDADKRILQYFGGWSQWQEEFAAEAGSREQLVLEMQKAMNRIRNTSFHYAADRPDEILDKNSLLLRIFRKEKAGLSELIRKKYHSNNVPVFYREADIEKLLTQIYKDYRAPEEQIPSFQSVLGWKYLLENIGSLLDRKSYTRLQTDVSIKNKFCNTFYFLLKEIYYKAFLQESDLKDNFLAAAHQKAKEEKDKTRKRAVDNFLARVDEYKDQNSNGEIGFGELCQRIMTDYNLQNPEKRVRSNRRDRLPEPKYEHFKMLLLECLREAFLEYVREDVMGACWKCGFLKLPKLRENVPSEEEFCKSWKADLYRNLSENNCDAWMISWFAAGHFMIPKHLNHLKGAVKGYLSYVKGIELRRRAAAKRPASEEESSTKESCGWEERYKRLLEVLDLASEYCGRISARWEDYYASEDEYAENVKQYVAYEDKVSGFSLSGQLCSFCNQKEMNSPSGYLGIYYNNGGPILNRNIVKAKLFGTEKLLARCLSGDRVTEEEIRECYRLLKRQEKAEKENAGKQNNKYLLEQQRKYQQQKNRIELVDILKYSDIINDLLSQLVSWAYLRERDRMYFQLGLHYIRLKYGKELVEKDSRLRILREKSAVGGKGVGLHIVDGAVLYQLAAIYTYELPVYTLDSEGYAVISKRAKAGSQTSNSVKAFYLEYCQKDPSVYEMGLEVFEMPSEEEELIRFRNYIDHAKYLARRDVSILELYSTVYAKFFRNDIKLKNSVPFVFQNILARHFVLAPIKLGYKVEEKEKETGSGIKKWESRLPQIQLKKLESEVTVHKNVTGKKETMDYYDKRFLDRLQFILEYDRG